MGPGRKNDRFVRNDDDKARGARFPFAAMFRCAFAGLAYTLLDQRNLKIYGAFTVAAIVLGFLFQLSMGAWLAVIVCIVLVISAECLNTAIESIVDLVSPEYHDLAKKAKDCGAAAVFVCALGALVVAVIVYGGAVAKLLISGFGQS